MTYQQQSHTPQGQEMWQSTSEGVHDKVYEQAVPLTNLGMAPAPVDCPACRARALTRISHHSGNTTHLWALIVFACTICCFWIPYTIKSLKDVDHHCGKCDVLLATWHKGGQVEVHMHA
ncbi:MAG: hypothetical protein M1834_002692 [Cirrosporium novae-zelandiae]|nr:MAG: hypothetical protein M1834_002692 [Cirrosporium novae-zelandiae]